tara:strand:+ start:759 stop:1283 length:525 start_codon:yes stop_codon:yes gene_type:complete
MKKTMKMSSFFLTIGLGCMLIYVLLQAFNIPIREGMKVIEHDPKDVKKWEEKGDALAKGLENGIDKLKTQIEKDKNMMKEDEILWEKCREPALELLKVKKTERSFHFQRMFGKMLPSQYGFSQEAKEAMKQIKLYDEMIELLSVKNIDLGAKPAQQQKIPGIEPEKKEKKKGWM